MSMTSHRSTLLTTTRWSSPVVILTALLLGSALPGSAQVTVENGCLEETAGFGVNCTANDVRIARAIPPIQINDDGCAFLGDTVNFTAEFEVELTAQERHDLGIYFSSDGDPDGSGA